MVTVQEYIDLHVTKLYGLIVYCSDHKIKEIAYYDIGSTFVDVKFSSFREIRTKSEIIEEIIYNVKDQLKIFPSNVKIVNNYHKDGGRGSIEVILS